MADLGGLEAAVMKQMWAASGPLSVRQMLDLLTQERTIAYTTVMTVMDRLYRKGHLTREPAGKAYLYRPAASHAGYVAAVMAGALNDSEDRVAALVHFTTQITKADASALRRALRSQARR